MSGRLDGKAALVTGGASGIGRAIAIKFAEEGANVTVADIRREPRLAETPTPEVIEDEGGTAQFVEADVALLDEIQGAVEETVDAYGSLDVMVNNAGVFPELQPIEGVAEEDYYRVMDVNLKGVYFGSQAAIEVMGEQESDGSIINMSSIAGLNGFPHSSLYCASKGAIANLSRELALEAGPKGVRVNAINPGVTTTAASTEDASIAGTMTDEIPLGRDARPEDVANVALFLASDESAYVSGHNLVVDGGLTAK